MPSFFSSKKKTSAPTGSGPASPSPSHAESNQAPASPSTTPSATPPATSPTKEKGKKSKGYFVRERDSKRQPSSSSNSRASRRLSETHPLNLPPEEIRRLSALSAMSAAQENGAGGGEPMEMTPAPEENVPLVNGVNGTESEEDESGPVPPPHRTPTSPSPQPEQQPEVPKVDAEACKAAGNKFYKAGSYERAIEEYSKGLSAHGVSSTEVRLMHW